jgi:type III pantothenate kinase
MTVVVDIGNTFMKWARVGTGELTDIGRAALAMSNPLEPLAAALAAPAGRIVAANVAGVEIETSLRALAQARGADLTIVKPLPQQYGVRCAYDNPARLGADRWVGVIAAHLLIAGPACVVDAGTTVTLDAVTAGRHLGGLIMAGPMVVASALGRETRGIGATTQAQSAAAGLELLGADTNTAVAHGAMLGIAAALDRAIAEVAAALGQPLTVVLTGGGAIALEPWLKTAVSYRPHFILEGLAQIAAES